MDFGDDIWNRQIEDKEGKYMKYFKTGCIVLIFVGLSYYLFNKYIKYSKPYYRFLSYLNNYEMKKRGNADLNHGTFFANDEFYPLSANKDTSQKTGTKYFIMFTGQDCPISNEKKTYIYGNNEIANKIKELFKKDNIRLLPFYEANTYGVSKYDEGTGPYYANIFEKRYNTKIKGFPSIYLLDSRNEKAYEYNAEVTVENMESFLNLVKID